MKYHVIRKMDIANGPGMRVSVFMQGCAFRCKNCFNPETWDFEGGRDLDDKTIAEVLKLCKEAPIRGLSILGGEPLHPKNIGATTKLAKAFKAAYPQKTVWLWSGYQFEQDLQGKEVMQYIDVLVDGRYVDELRNPALPWRGSENQRVIDVAKSLEKGEAVLIET